MTIVNSQGHFTVYVGVDGQWNQCSLYGPAYVPSLHGVPRPQMLCFHLTADDRANSSQAFHFDRCVSEKRAKLDPERVSTLNQRVNIYQRYLSGIKYAICTQ